MGGDPSDAGTDAGADRAGIDEVGVDLGPDDAAGGLLDGWDGRTVPGTEATAARGEVEVTGVIDAVGPAAVAVMARVAGGYARGAEPGRLAPLRGQPSGALKRRLAEEPVDALPTRSNPAAAASRAPARSLTAPGVPVPGVSAPGVSAPGVPGPGVPVVGPPRTEIGSGLLLGAVLLALAAGAAGAWLVLGGW